MPQLLNSTVGPVGLGLMGMTWRPQQTPDEQAFEAMKAALAAGANFWNSGEFYGYPEPTLNLQLLSRYFARYPADAAKVVLSVKGGVNLADLHPNGAPAFVKASVDNVLATLGPHKKLDIFQCARVDAAVPIETTVGALAEYVAAGKIGGIGLSEVSAAIIRKAHAVHPIAAVEVEVSLWSTQIFENGVADACKELGIPVVAYSPLGRGFLTGTLKSLDDIPAGDFRRTFTRFQPGNFEKNLELVDAVKKVAAKKGVTPGQLALAWVLKQGEKRKQVIIPIPGATRKDRVEENLATVQLSDADLEEVDAILAQVTVIGGRYDEAHEKLLHV